MVNHRFDCPAVHGFGECECGAKRRKTAEGRLTEDPHDWTFGLRPEPPTAALKLKPLSNQLRAEYAGHPKPKPEKPKSPRQEEPATPVDGLIQASDEERALWVDKDKGYVHNAVLRGPEGDHADLQWYDPGCKQRNARSGGVGAILAVDVLKAFQAGCGPGQFKMSVCWRTRDDMSVRWHELSIEIRCEGFTLRFPIVGCDYSPRPAEGLNWKATVLRHGRPITELVQRPTY